MVEKQSYLLIYKMEANVKIRIILADNHRIMREGLCSLFQKQAGMEVVGEADNGEVAIERAGELKPDVIVMDINIPGMDGIKVSRRIMSENPTVKILVLSAHLHKHIIDHALRAGVLGFVLKECTFEELTRAICTVQKNGTYMCPGIMNVLVTGYVSQLRTDTQPDFTALTEREYEIIRLLSQGKTSKEIALCKDISPKTVDACRRAIMDKLKINSLAELIKYAVRVGITNI